MLTLTERAEREVLLQRAEANRKRAIAIGTEVPGCCGYEPCDFLTEEEDFRLLELERIRIDSLTHKAANS